MTNIMVEKDVVLIEHQCAQPKNHNILSKRTLKHTITHIIIKHYQKA